MNNPQNPLLEFLQKFPNKNWNWVSISKNRHLNRTIINKFISHWNKTCWANISGNLSISTYELIDLTDQYSTVNWDWDQISMRSDLTIEFILRKQRKAKPWNWKKLSQYLILDTIKNIIQNDTTVQLLDWNSLSANFALTVDFIRKHPTQKWNWREISKNKSIGMFDIQNNLTLPWDWNSVSANPNLTMMFINANSHYKWNWAEISNNKTISLEFIRNHISDNWSWTNLSRNPYLTDEFINEFCHKPWSWIQMATIKNPLPVFKTLEKNLFSRQWSILSKNIFITPRVIELNSQIPWNWTNISKNKNVQLEYIESNLSKPWDWFNGISQNPNLTVDFVKKHFEKQFNFSALSENEFHDPINATSQSKRRRLRLLSLNLI